MWKTKTTLIFATLFLALIPFVQATGTISDDCHIAIDTDTWLITGQTITFNCDTISYGNNRVTFGESWITSNVDVTLTAWFENNWTNYTVTESGTQQIYTTTMPINVYRDGTKISRNYGWSYESSLFLIEDASSSVAIDFNPETIVQRGGGFSLNVLFRARYNDAPLANCTINVYEIYGYFFIENLLTDEKGEVEQQLPISEYRYIAKYGDLQKNGSFVHSSYQIIWIDFSHNPLDMQAYLRTPLALLIVVLVAIVALVKVRKI